MTTLYTTIGRCNPPTPFHLYLMSILLSKEGDKKFYLSSTIDKNNPLSYEQKKSIFEYVYPESKSIISDECNNFVNVLKKHSGQYSNLVFLCGIDRVNDYQRIIDKYNHRDFEYENIELISLGTDYIRGLVSASKLRQSFYDDCTPCFHRRYLKMKYDIEIHFDIEFPFNINTVSGMISRELEGVGYKRKLKSKP